MSDQTENIKSLRAMSTNGTYHGEFRRGLFVALPIIENLTAKIKELEAEREWVSVETRLPKFSGWCSVLVNSRIHQNSQYLARFHNGKFDKLIGYSGKEMPELIELITHWNEPPKP